MREGDTVKMTRAQLAKYSPVLARYMGEIRWRVLEKDGNAIKIMQLGAGRISYARADEFEEATNEGA